VLSSCQKITLQGGHLPPAGLPKKSPTSTSTVVCFMCKPTLALSELMQRLETRLAKEKYWDQTAYNEEIFFLSHDNYKSPQVKCWEVNDVTGPSP